VSQVLEPDTTDSRVRDTLQRSAPSRCGAMTWRSVAGSSPSGAASPAYTVISASAKISVLYVPYMPEMPGEVCTVQGHSRVAEYKNRAS
jgi:hypothetical protein